MFADDSMRPRRSRFGSPAGFLDTAAVVALVAALSFVFFAGRIQSPWVALAPSALFTAAATTVLLRVRARRRRLYRLALERQAYDLWLADDLLRAEPAKFQKFALSILLFQCHWRYLPAEEGGPLLRRDERDGELALLRRHPDAPVGPQDVLELVDRARANGRSLLVIATTAVVTDEARRFAQELPDVEVCFYDGKELAAMAWDGACAPPVEALEPYLERAASLVRARRKAKRPRFAQWAVSLRFVAVALLLTALSWLTPYRQWYLVSAAVCLAIGGAALLLPGRWPFRRQSR